MTLTLCVCVCCQLSVCVTSSVVSRRGGGARITISHSMFDDLLTDPGKITPTYTSLRSVTLVLCGVVVIVIVIVIVIVML